MDWKFEEEDSENDVEDMARQDGAMWGESAAVRVEAVGVEATALGRVEHVTLLYQKTTKRRTAHMYSSA